MANINFSKDFIVGTATASYQIEGAANEDGKGESIWDRFSHIPGKILNGDNGDTACDHYHRFKDDVRLMKELGINGYRFSISWSRVLPEGKGKVNQDGIDFYDRLVDELLENGIDPMVTLYHWDLPQALQDLGGWGNRDITDYFQEYSGHMFKALSDRVKKWNTHNEPWVVAFAGHYYGRHAPGLTDFPMAVQVSHHLMLSHAKAVQVYKSFNKNDGKMGIALNLYPMYPASDSQEDKEAALLVDGYHNRWFLDPILKGNYPEDMLKLYQDSFGAPIIHTGDMDLIASNAVDFLGINYYFRKVIKKDGTDSILKYKEIKPQGSDYTEMEWEIYPQGLYDLLKRIKDEYNDPHIYITENGAAFKDDKITDGIIYDDDRVNFLKQHFETASKCIEDGIKLDGYYIWSLMDNFEWAHGYSKRFGLFHIDYKTRDRLWKKSALWLKDLLKGRSI